MADGLKFLRGVLSSCLEICKTRAPIDKLAQHRGYPFAGTIEEKPEEVEYWLELITHIVTKQFVELVGNHNVNNSFREGYLEVLCGAIQENYISKQHLDERRKKFLYLKQGSEPIVLYASEFRKYYKYGLETRGESSRQKAKRSGSNYIPRLEYVFKPSALINDDDSMKISEKAHAYYQTRRRKQKRDDRPQWQSKKAKYQNEDSINYTPAPMSNFTPRPPTGIKLAIPTVSVSSEGNLE
ncbi:hypothetical protein GQ457_12G012600 [Hibiscus cannabinus]